MRIALALLLSFFLPLALGAPGDLDSTFGSAGLSRVDLNAGLGDAGKAIAKLADDRLVLVGAKSGDSTGPVLSRYLANGGLDTTFGASGSVQTPIARWMSSVAIAVQSDGGIVTAGTVLALDQTGNPSPPNTHIIVVRQDATGALDPTFGGTGVVEVNFGVPTVAHALAIGPIDQKIVVAGTNFSVARLNTDGSLDTTFNGTGLAMPAIPSITAGADANAILIEPDGRTVVVGVGRRGPGNPVSYPVVVRFKVDGSLDNPFGNGGTGVYTFGTGSNEGAYSVAYDQNGKILVGGAYTPVSMSGAGFLRINPDGTLDTSFGSGGAVAVLGPAGANALALQPSGKILAGMFDFHVVRLFPDGSVDPGFSSPGVGTQPFAYSSGGIVTQAGGNIVLGGSGGSNNAQDHLLARFDASDTSPASFRFTPRPNATPGSTRVSNTVTIANLLSDAPISVTGGEYSIGCTSSFTTVALTIQNGQSVCVRHVASSAYATSVSTTLTVGTVSATFTSTTITQTGDADNDGVPNTVEVTEGLDPNVKDNDIFALATKGARLFAMQQYRDFLGREGDPNGITSWTNYILSADNTRPITIRQFLSSNEFQGTVAPVARLYFASFLRVPDYPGLTFWIGYFRAGNSLAAIANAFVASAEFTSRYGSTTNPQFVDLVYQNVLGRAADPSGKSYWVAQLDSGTSRGTMMAGFSESSEYVAAIQTEVNVTMTYTGMLRRAPDPSGFSFWVNYVNGGQSLTDLIGAFLVAPEYRQRFLP